MFCYMLLFWLALQLNLTVLDLSCRRQIHFKWEVAFWKGSLQRNIPWKLKHIVTLWNHLTSNTKSPFTWKPSTHRITWSYIIYTYADRDINRQTKMVCKNATWLWQWALPVSAITPCSFSDMTFSKSVVNKKYKQMGMYFCKLVQGQIERATMVLHVIVSF